MDLRMEHLSTECRCMGKLFRLRTLTTQGKWHTMLNTNSIVISTCSDHWITSEMPMAFIQEESVASVQTVCRTELKSEIMAINPSTMVFNNRLLLPKTVEWFRSNSQVITMEPLSRVPTTEILTPWLRKQPSTQEGLEAWTQPLSDKKGMVLMQAESSLRKQ